MPHAMTSHNCSHRMCKWNTVYQISLHYNDVIMGAMTSQITSLMIVYSIVCSGADQKHQSSASLAFVWGIHHWLVNSPHKGPVTRKIFPFDDGIMLNHASVPCTIFHICMAAPYGYDTSTSIWYWEHAHYFSLHINKNFRFVFWPACGICSVNAEMVTQMYGQMKRQHL